MDLHPQCLNSLESSPRRPKPLLCAFTISVAFYLLIQAPLSVPPPPPLPSPLLLLLLLPHSAYLSHTNDATQTQKEIKANECSTCEWAIRFTVATCTPKFSNSIFMMLRGVHFLTRKSTHTIHCFFAFTLFWPPTFNTSALLEPLRDLFLFSFLLWLFRLILVLG